MAYSPFLVSLSNHRPLRRRINRIGINWAVVGNVMNGATIYVLLAGRVRRAGNGRGWVSTRGRRLDGRGLFASVSTSAVVMPAGLADHSDIIG